MIENECSFTKNAIVMHSQNNRKIFLIFLFESYACSVKFLKLPGNFLFNKLY